MARRTIRLRYQIRFTRRVRIETRVRYSVHILTTARYVVERARSHGMPLSKDELVDTARAMLPAGTDEDNIRDAIDTVCPEVDEGE